jgi:hypothetical protein
VLDSDPPIKIVAISAVEAVEGDCTGAATEVIGSSSEGSEASNGDAWASGTNDLQLWVFSRQGYYNSGNKIFYAYARQLVIDKCGKITDVSGEVRIEIFTTEVCETDVTP